MFGIGGVELLIVGIIGVLLFGSQLPKMARNLGASIPQFKKGMREVEREVAELDASIQKIKEA